MRFAYYLTISLSNALIEAMRTDRCNTVSKRHFSNGAFVRAENILKAGLAGRGIYNG